jgi:uncharacterized protein (TIGR00251 family)
VIKDTPTGVEIAVRVLPRARKNELAGTRGDALLVRLTAPPVDGAANAALVELFAEHLDVPRHSVRIVHGERSRDKRVAVSGMTADRLIRLLANR